MSGVLLKRKHARTVLEVALTLAKEDADEVLISMERGEIARVEGVREDKSWAVLDVSTTSGDVLSFYEEGWLEWGE